MKALSDIGLVGLGVMGRNLALNMESKGLQVSVFNYIPSVTEEFLAGSAEGRRFIGSRSYEELVASLAVPRKVFLMVTAGSAVDEVISHLKDSDIKQLVKISCVPLWRDKFRRMKNRIFKKYG